jgi:hypothetical protein
MSKLAQWIIFAVILLGLGIFTIMLSINAQSNTKVYDCSIAEFHPDFPPRVKEECRMLKNKTWT